MQFALLHGENATDAVFVRPEGHLNPCNSKFLGCGSEFPRVWILCKELIQPVGACGGETAGNSSRNRGLEAVEVADEAVGAIGKAAEEDPSWDRGEEEKGYEAYADPEHFVPVEWLERARFELGEGVDDSLFLGATARVRSDLMYSQRAIKDAEWQGHPMVIESAQRDCAEGIP